VKAFQRYARDEVALRKVLAKLRDLGTLNCSFEQFNDFFVEWHLKAFPLENWKKHNPGMPYKADPTTALLWNDTWFMDFVEFLAGKDI